MSKLTAMAEGEPDEKLKSSASVLKLEFERLEKQICPYCDGYGHSGNDCPTDSKIDNMRGGVKEQNKVIQTIRAQCRALSGMSEVKGFSLLSANPRRVGQGKRLFSEAFGDN